MKRGILFGKGGSCPYKRTSKQFRSAMYGAVYSWQRRIVRLFKLLKKWDGVSLQVGRCTSRAEPSCSASQKERPTDLMLMTGCLSGRWYL